MDDVVDIASLLRIAHIEDATLMTGPASSSAPELCLDALRNAGFRNVSCDIVIL